MQLYFYGWILDRRLRYMSYVWTSNTSLGQTSQVVVAGNLTFRFNERLTLGAGVSGLPGVRTTEGTFPYWFGADTRHLADEYFRPSYSTGLFADGQIARGLQYKAMWANNLSQFGIDAGQLDNSPDTLSASLIWMPTTGEFGRQGGFGDFDAHDKLATRLAVHFTRSDENRQSQPNTDAFENVQIRVSDGSVIFTPGLFAEGLQVEAATYRMLSIDGGVKYRGLSFDVEIYRRIIDDFDVRGPGALPFERLRDTGFQIHASAMAIPSTVQVYAGASRVFGEYGDPRDFRTGLTFFPWRNQVVRWNFEFLHLTRSPVGAASYPYGVGSTGPVFHSNFMVWF